MRGPADGPTRLLRAAAASVAAGACLLWLALALTRLAHPFELEWQEGGVLQTLERLLAGRALYAAPDLEFIAFPYPPLYPALAALPSLGLGASFGVLRGVSIAATLCMLWLLVVEARRMGCPPAGALLGAGLFAAAYRFCGAWYDVARPDATAYALLLGAYALLRRGGGARGALAAGALASLAFLAKQSCLPAAAALALGLAGRSRRDAVAFVASLGLGLAASTLALDAWSGGWYRWTVFVQLAGHPLEPAAWTGLWLELAAAFPIAALLPAWALARRRARPDGLRAAFVAGLLLCAWIGRLHAGGYDNVLLPAVLALALPFGEAVGRLGAPGAALALVQLGLLAYWPAAQLPTRADRVAGEHLVARLAAVEGDVLVPYHGYLARRVGKGGGPHGMAVHDLLRSESSRVATAWVARLEAALDERRWTAIVLDDASWEEQLPGLLRNYLPAERLFGPNEGGLFVPVTGAPWRPELLYRRR